MIDLSATDISEILLRTVLPWLSENIARGFDVAPALMTAVFAGVALPAAALGAVVWRWSRRWRQRSPDRTLLLSRRRDYPVASLLASDDMIVSPAARANFHTGDDLHTKITAASARRTFFAVGRGDDNDVVVNDRSVHRNHAAIYRDDHGRFLIEDLTSRQGNGIAVNGKICSQAALSDGDVIELGRERVVFRMTPLATAQARSSN